MDKKTTTTRFIPLVEESPTTMPTHSVISESINSSDIGIEVSTEGLELTLVDIDGQVS
eukprot:CAMPEP_0202465984 /NCGR_PEP_ID=MMETSP1360-20130828/67289_1 /ASSEMBLY_ACC=CAM_ASM_000848 /TAXON_ID=515479 /ORGANISM="Licmophora paradoxa, Strain CCMP2313" /LENGTH=57 /DNA_ID=CAMNT_0049089965 /DNA_START=127 /DNA_END=296 /DNA_ORIENTATION=+